MFLSPDRFYQSDHLNDLKSSLIGILNYSTAKFLGKLIQKLQNQIEPSKPFTGGDPAAFMV